MAGAGSRFYGGGESVYEDSFTRRLKGEKERQVQEPGCWRRGLDLWDVVGVDGDWRGKSVGTL